MKVHKHKMWPLILFAIIITLFTTLLGVEYIAAVTIDNYQKENEDFDQSMNNVSTLISNDLNKYTDSLHAFSQILSNAYQEGQQIHIDTLLHTMKMTNQFDDLHIISQNNVSSRVADGIILQTMDSLVIYSYIPNTSSYLYGSIDMTRVYEYMNTLIKDDIFDIYLLDQDKNIVISMYDRPLDYHSIDEADFYHVDLEYSNFKDHLYTLIDSDSADHNERLTANMYPVQELLTSIRHYHDLMKSVIES